MQKFVKKQIRACDHCQRNKFYRASAPMKVILTTKRRQRAVLDTTEMHKDRFGYVYIIVLVDAHTKHLWAKKCRARDAESVVNWLWEQFHDEPFEIWVCDNGGEFVNKLMDAFIEKIKVILPSARVVHGRPHHPQSQGRVERANQTLKKILESLMIEAGWSKEDGD